MMRCLEKADFLDATEKLIMWQIMRAGGVTAALTVEERSDDEEEGVEEKTYTKLSNDLVVTAAHP